MVTFLSTFSSASSSLLVFCFLGIFFFFWETTKTLPQRQQPGYGPGWEISLQHRTAKVGLRNRRWRIGVLGTVPLFLFFFLLLLATIVGNDYAQTG